MFTRADAVAPPLSEGVELIIVNEAFGPGRRRIRFYPRELLSALIESGPPRPEIAVLLLTRVLREPRTADQEGGGPVVQATAEALTGSSVGVSWQ